VIDVVEIEGRPNEDVFGDVDAQGDSSRVDLKVMHALASAAVDAGLLLEEKLRVAAPTPARSSVVIRFVVKRVGWKIASKL
jgi:hypothetical protein